MDMKDVLKQLAAIQRQRMTVRGSLCTEEMKAKLLAELDRSERELKFDAGKAPAKG